MVLGFVRTICPGCSGSKSSTTRPVVQNVVEALIADYGLLGDMGMSGLVLTVVEPFPPP